MFFISAIVFGIFLLILDGIVLNILKQKISITGLIDHAIDKVSGGNLLYKLFIILGTPAGLFFLQQVFSGNSVLYGIFTILFVISLGYLGASWFKG
ncbi:MAG: hypothetical protein AAB516_00555 [Patescibacteria group bacterium]